MIVRINHKSGKPPYLQIAEQIRRAVATGALRTGEALPTIRQLAEDLRINRNTVAKAYTELEREGLLETRTGSGSYIRENKIQLKKTARQEMLVEAVDEAIVQAHHFQISDEELREILEKRLAEFRRGRARSNSDSRKGKT